MYLVVVYVVCVLGVGSVVAGLLGLLLGWLVMCIVCVSVRWFDCWLCCCRASWATVGLVVGVHCSCICYVFQLLALLLQGFLGCCWADC
jgi:hypothetical protein